MEPYEKEDLVPVSGFWVPLRGIDFFAGSEIYLRAGQPFPAFADCYVPLDPAMWPISDEREEAGQA